MSILTALAQIMATALSIVAGALAAFVSFLLSARAAAELKLMEIGSEVRANFNRYDHLMLLSSPDTATELLERYRYSFPDDSSGARLWRIFFDLTKKSSASADIDLPELVKREGIPKFGAVMCHFAELAIDSLDPNSADRRFDIINFSPEYLEARAYRSIVFPNGVVRFEEWFNIFVSFERMTNMLIYRHVEIIQEIIELRINFSPAYVEKRLNDMLTLAKGVSPLAYQADAINRDITRASSAVQLAKAPSLIRALLVASAAGVALPLFLLLYEPLVWQTGLVCAALVLSAACLFWIVTRVVKVMRASVPVSYSRFAAISILREYFSGAAVDQNQELIVAVDLPISYRDIRKLSPALLSKALEEYETAARSTVAPGEILRKLLVQGFSESKLSETYPATPNQGGIILRSYP